MPFVPLKQTEELKNEESPAIQSNRESLANIPVKSHEHVNGTALFGLSFYDETNLKSFLSLFNFNQSNPSANASYSYSATELAYSKLTSTQTREGTTITQESEYVRLYPAKVNLPSYIYGSRPYTRNENDSQIELFTAEFLASLSGQFQDEYGNPRIPNGMSFAITVPIEKWGAQSEETNEKIRAAYEKELKLQLNGYEVTQNITLTSKTFNVSYSSFVKKLNPKKDKYDWQTLREDLKKNARTETGAPLEIHFITELNSASTFEQFQKVLIRNSDNLFFGENHHKIPSINEQMGKFRTAVASDDCRLGINEKGEITYDSSLPQEYHKALYAQQNGTKAYLRMPDKSYVDCTFRYDAQNPKRKPYLVDENNNEVSVASILKGEPVGSTATIYDSEWTMLAKWIKINEKMHKEEPQRIGGILISAPVSAFLVKDPSEEMNKLLKNSIQIIENTNSQFENGHINKKPKELKINKQQNHDIYFSNFAQSCEDWLDGKTQTMPEELNYKSIIVISDGAVTDTESVISEDTGEHLREVLDLLKKAKKEECKLQKIEFIMVAPKNFRHPHIGEDTTLHGGDKFKELANVAGTSVSDAQIENAEVKSVLNASSDYINVTWIVSPDIAYKSNYTPEEISQMPTGRGGSARKKDLFSPTSKTQEDLAKYGPETNNIFQNEYYRILKSTTEPEFAEQ